MSEEEGNTEVVSDEQSVADAISDDRPDWLLDRYMTDGRSIADATAEQAKGYNEIRGKLGSFTGAPDSYEFTLNDQLKESGIELDADNPLIASFTEMAKEAGMGQDMANQLVNMFVESQHADSIGAEESEDARIADEMKLLGDNAQSRVDNLKNWTNANIDAEKVKGLADALGSAAGVEFVEALIAKSRNAPMTNTDAQETTSISADELHKLQFAKDDNGNRKMQTDPEYRKMVQQKFSQAYPGENVITVG